MNTPDQVRFIFKQLRKLLDLEEQLTLALKDENDMTQAEKDLIAAFDAATSRIAARIQKLIDAGGASPEFIAALQAEVTGLDALGKDPTTPIPTGV